jgi:hypothetical protein
MVWLKWQPCWWHTAMGSVRPPATTAPPLTAPPPGAPPAAGATAIAPVAITATVAAVGPPAFVTFSLRLSYVRWLVHSSFPLFRRLTG